MTNPLSEQNIFKKIFIIRNHRVMIDRDLAELYGVTTKRLNEQVKRNIKRFPTDFMYHLTKSEFTELVANCDRLNILKHSSSLPYVFTENGVAMLSSILNSDRAIAVNIRIMRVFTGLRKMLSEYGNLSKRIDAMEQKYDANFRNVFAAIRGLLEIPAKPKKQIGFITNKK